MPKDEKTTVKRFLKRNTLNILIGLTVLMLIGVIVLGVILFLDLREPAQPEPETQPAAEELPEEQLPEAEEPAEPETPKDPGWQEDGEFVPPFEGETEFLAVNCLALTYDAEKLKLTVDGGLHTLLSVDGGSTPRMDLQQMVSSLDQFEDADLDRLAIGILQAYYYVAPKTEDIVLSQVSRTETSYNAVLSAPAYDNAPAMEAKIRLMEVGGQFWYAMVLLPEDADTAAFEQAFDNLMMK